LRIILADHRREIRSALRLLLEQQPDAWEVLGEAADLYELAACLKKACPDVLLLDWELPGMLADRWNPDPDRPASMMKHLRELCPQMRIVALSSQPEECAMALQAGADEIVCKTDPPEQLLKKIYFIPG
jgi:DNA-binding NarL/FixJ family response regulator